ncbi:proteasome inhibitor-like protein [Thalictrum thalictroides]|uniref:Proteasome inhibitor-like protein n=1 Tax=Thalictrum thalictroides TaxID=46969 RepID=A0A7J6VED2_THATH|nr:proteasome inhibitor-like protein [Thalictrum thalictroides]
MATEEAIMAVIKASRPSFRNPHDKIAFSLHATFLASGYSLVATGVPAFSDNVFSSPPQEEVEIDGWNETDDGYGFVYTKKEKGLKNTVVVKCLVMGDNLLIDALSTKTQDKEPFSLQINVISYDGDNESTNLANRYKDFTKLVKTFKSDILDKVEDKPSVGSTSASSRPEQERNQPEHDVYEPYSSSGFNLPPVMPFLYNDRIPLPPAGTYPRGGPDIGGPMLIGPNDPRWLFPPGGRPGFPDVPPGIHPGARFDPFGPPGVPGFEPGRFGRNQPRPGPPHPDLQPFGNPDDFI